MKRLERISWNIDKDGYYVLEKLDSAKSEDRIVFLWRGKGIRKDISLKTLAKKSIGNSISLMLTTGGDKREDGGIAYQLGPLVDIYQTLVNQGAIIEHEPTIKITGQEDK